MMLTRAELSGLAAVSGGGRLVGLPPAESGPAVAETALEGLIAKGVLGRDGKVTRFGAVPVRVVEQYLQAERHVAINQLRVSVNDDGALTTLLPVGEGWHLARMTPVEVLTSLSRSHPWLGMADADDTAGEWEPLTVEQWVAARAGLTEKSVLVVHWSEGSTGRSETEFFDWVGGSGFTFDYIRGMGRRLPIGAVRSRISACLGGATDQEYGGSHG